MKNEQRTDGGEPTARYPLDVGVKEKDMDIYRIYTALPE